MTPLTVVVMCGGRSSEHDVSLSSGDAVRAGLEMAGHRVLTVLIDRDGVWRLDGAAVSVSPGEGLFGADVVFPALHGPFGEDGTIQGLLESIGVPYVGSDVASSALCMDKLMFKDLMSLQGVHQVDYAGVRAARFQRARADALADLARLGLPVFVKPSHLGSSVGIAKVSRPDELVPALERAFTHDELVIVEAMARGLEVECGVLELPRGPDASGAHALASEPGEIVIESEWYDYAAKYQPGGMELQVPARITTAARARVMELAVDAFMLAGCAGLARADFFVDGDAVLLNELNTMPGFTPTSVYAKLLTVSGVEYPELVDRLCRLAIERSRRLGAYRR